MKKIPALIVISCVALSSCAHKPLKAPCDAAKLASSNGGPCDPKPINFALSDDNIVMLALLTD